MELRLYWLYITTFLDLLATSLLIPFLPMHLRAYGLPRLVVGVVTSVYPSVQLFSSPAVGYYSERYGHKITLITSLLLCSMIYYLIASTSSILIIFLCRVGLGVVKHTQTICKAVFLCHYEIFPKNASFGGFTAVEALGFMLGPVIGAHFIGREDGFRYLCKITTALFFINAITAYFFLPKEKQVINCSTKKNEHATQICKNRYLIDMFLFWDILALKLLLCVSLSLFYINYHIMVVEHLQMSPSMVGYTNSFQGLVCIVTSLFSNKISDLFLKLYYLKLSFCFLILSSSFFCIDLVSNPGTFVIYLIPLSCSSSLLRIYLTEALISNISSSNKASVIGIENTVATTASLMSPFIFEYFSYVSGTLSITYLAFLISGLGSLFSLILSVCKKQSQSQPVI